MPWEIKKDTALNKFCVHKKMMDGSMGAKVSGGCHDTMEEAKTHMAALYANEGKSLFSDALRQSERRTWELWDAVRTAASEIANAKRSEKVTGAKVDVAKKVNELIGDYAAEVTPAIIEQINEYADSDTQEPFYLKAQTMEKLLRTIEEHHTPKKQAVSSGNSDALAFYGGAVKALGDGKIAGYGVLYSGVADPDLQGEYFTKSTDLMLDIGDRRPVLYRHGAHPSVKSRKLGTASLKNVDEVGAFFQGELDLRDKYEKAIYRLAELGKLGWSTGSLTHLVSKEVKEVNGKSATEITCWPVGEISLTPTPVEGRTSVFAVKDIVIPDDEIDFDLVVKSVEQGQFDEQFDIDGIPSIKQFCEAVSPTSMKDGTARSKAAVDATKEFNTIGKLLGEGFNAYASRLVRRTENRFLKEGREIHPATVQQVNQLLSEIRNIEMAFSSVKESLLGLKNISQMSIVEQKALDEKARIELWNFCRIVGMTPEELNT